MMKDGAVDQDDRAVRASSLLTQADQIRREVRADRRRPARVALMVTGVIFALAGVVYRIFPAVQPQEIPIGGGGWRIPREDALANLGGQPPHRAAAVYWLLAVPSAWAVCAVIFGARRRRGLGMTPVATAIVGSVPFGLLVVLELLVAPRNAGVHELLDGPMRVCLPGVAMGVGLALVALLERDPWLAGVAAVVLVGAQWLTPWPLGPGFESEYAPWGIAVLQVSRAVSGEEGMLWWGTALLVGSAVWWARSRRATVSS